MEKATLDLYCDKLCKFKLKTGNEIYGIVWKKHSPVGDTLYFSSSKDYNQIQERGDINPNLKTVINVDDFVAVELLQGVIPGKDMFK